MRGEVADASRPAPVVILALALAGMVASLQQMLMVPVLPSVAGRFGVSPDTGTWMVTASLLAGAVATPIVSRRADMVGKRRMILWCLAAMTAGSLVIAVADTFAMAVVGRALQGLAAALIPVGISIMRDVLPPARVGMGVALMSGTLGIGASLALPLSGLLYTHAGWASLHWVSGTGSALGFLAVLLLVGESRVRTQGRFDVAGALVLSCCLTALLLAVSKGGTWGWTDPPVVLLSCGAVAGLAVWTVVELRVSEPLVDLRTAARRPVLLTNVATALISIAMYLNILLTMTVLQLPRTLEHGMGLDASAAGLAMVPVGLVMVVASPVAGVVIRRTGARTVLATGALVMSGAYVVRVPFSESTAAVVVGATVVGLGVALAFAAMPMVIMSEVPITETAAANGLNSLMRAVGGAVSTAVFAAVTTSLTTDVGDVEVAGRAAVEVLLVLGAVTTASAAAVAWSIPARGIDELRRSTEGTASTGHERETVLHGTLGLGGRPPSPGGAVVTVTRTDGSPVDWSRCDHEGRYAIVVPGSGSYVLVGNARGWSSEARVVEVGDGTTDVHLELTDELTISGAVRADGLAVPGAVVLLHHGTGDFHQAATTDARGRYRFALPPAGPYVLTAASEELGRARASKVIIAAHQQQIDVDLAAGDQARALRVPGGAGR